MGLKQYSSCCLSVTVASGEFIGTGILDPTAVEKRSG